MITKEEKKLKPLRVPTLSKLLIGTAEDNIELEKHPYLSSIGSITYRTELIENSPKTLFDAYKDVMADLSKESDFNRTFYRIAARRALSIFLSLNEFSITTENFMEVMCLSIIAGEYDILRSTTKIYQAKCSSEPVSEYERLAMRTVQMVLSWGFSDYRIDDIIEGIENYNLNSDIRKRVEWYSLFVEACETMQVVLSSKSKILVANNTPRIVEMFKSIVSFHFETSAIQLLPTAIEYYLKDFSGE